MERHANSEAGGMMQTEGTRMTAEDRRELENQIDLQEERVENLYGDAKREAVKELRRLRRLR